MIALGMMMPGKSFGSETVLQGFNQSNFMFIGWNHVELRRVPGAEIMGIP